MLAALIALLALLTQLLAPLSLPIATARLTFMELAEPLLVHALLVLTAPLMLKQQQLPLPLLLADAKQTLTEQQWTTVPHAHFALLQIHALLLVLTKLHAVALLIHTGTQTHAQVALLVLPRLLGPLPLLLACARLTGLEIPVLVLHVLLVLALYLVPVLAKQPLPLPLSLLLAHVLPAPGEMVPHAQTALLVLPRLLHPLSLLLATA